MNPFFSPDLILPTLWWSGIVLVFVMVSLVFYGYLADGTFFEGKGRVHYQSFGQVDALIAGGLATLFGVISLQGFGATAESHSDKLPDGTQMIFGILGIGVIFAGLIAVIIGSLVIRHISWQEVFGIRRAGFAEVVLKGGLLLLFAYPMIAAAVALTRIVLSASGYGEEGPQDIVRFLAQPNTGAARLVVAVDAIIFAPIREEFIFRGFIYGVLRRYAGPGVGLVVNAALFAGIHLHAPSLGGLFVLAACLTLAYEWTGSIFVPITMHALFNALSVVSLLNGAADF